MNLSNQEKQKIQGVIKSSLVSFLENVSVKTALVKLLGSAAMGGFRAWLIKLIVENLFEQIAEPIIRAGITQLGYEYSVHEGKVLIKKLEEARHEGNQDSYDHAADDVLN